MRYLHGGDVYRDRVEYDFSININPLGMPQECVKAAKEGVALSSALQGNICEEENKRGLYYSGKWSSGAAIRAVPVPAPQKGKGSRSVLPRI